MASGYKNAFSILALLGTLWAVLATSSPRDSFTYGSYHVISDCVSPVLEADVEVTDLQITSPAGLSFTDFGFPQNQISPDADMKGEVNGVPRHCRRTYGDTDRESSEWIFTCYDNDEAACSIFMK